MHSLGTLFHQLGQLAPHHLPLWRDGDATQVCVNDMLHLLNADMMLSGQLLHTLRGLIPQSEIALDDIFVKSAKHCEQYIHVGSVTIRDEQSR